MLGGIEDRIDIGGFDLLTQVHDDDLVRHFGNHPQIVGDDYPT